MKALTVLGLIAIGCYLGGQRAHQRGTRPANRVREAGTRRMRNPPRDWDMVDERADESFPASDPPGTY